MYVYIIIYWWFIFDHIPIYSHCHLWFFLMLKVWHVECWGPCWTFSSSMSMYQFPSCARPSPRWPGVEPEKLMKHDETRSSDPFFRKKSNGSPAASWSRSEVTTPFYTRLGWFKRRVVEIWIQGKLKSCTSQRRSQVTHRAGDVLINQFMSICWWASDHVFMFFLHVPQSCCSNIPGWFVSP